MKNRGGQFEQELGGHFQPKSGGHFKSELGGQFDRNLQNHLLLYSHPRKIYASIFSC